MKGAVVILSTAAVALVSLGGCGEKPQAASTRKSDMQAWQGTANTARANTGWTSGDRESWVLHMQSRAQNQNEYTRTTVPPRAPAP